MAGSIKITTDTEVVASTAETPGQGEMDSAGSTAQGNHKPLQHGLDAADWESTIQKVVSAIVSVQYYRPFNFDSDASGTAQATGFVVDTELG